MQELLQRLWARQAIGLPRCFYGLRGVHGSEAAMATLALTVPEIALFVFLS